jgi:hypothetical protein
MSARYSFAERFAAMSESDLQREASEVKDLIPEARAALRAEMDRRHLSVKKTNWNAQAGGPDTRKAKHIGDTAGEYTEVPRGKYRAWVHVVIAFAVQAVLLGVLLAKAMEILFHAESPVAVPVGLSLGLAIAVLIYDDRWHCIEAFSSLYCTGLLTASLFVVPIVAFCYANYRGFRKLRRR